MLESDVMEQNMLGPSAVNTPVPAEDFAVYVLLLCSILLRALPAPLSSRVGLDRTPG